MKYYRFGRIRKTEMPILQWFAMTITIPYIREGGRTVGSGRVATIVE